MFYPSDRVSRQICSGGAKSLPYSGFASQRSGVFADFTTVDERLAFIRDLFSSVFDSEDKLNEAKFSCFDWNVLICYTAFLTEEQAEAISKYSSDLLLRKDSCSVILHSTPLSNSMMPKHDSGPEIVPMDVDE